MIFRFHEEQEWGLTHLSFEYRGWRYGGRGILRWVPEKGFRLDAFVDRDVLLKDPDPHTDGALRPSGLIRREHYHLIRARSPGHKFVAVPEYPLVWISDLLKAEGRISLQPTRVVFCQHFSGSSSERWVEEESRFMGSHVLLPDSVKTTDALAGRVLSIGEGKNALSWSGAEHQSLLRKIGDDTIVIRTSFGPSMSRRREKEWLLAVRTAMGLLSGADAEPVARESWRKGWLYTQVLAAPEVMSRERFVLFPPSVVEVDRSRFVKLVDFMFTTPSKSFVLRGILGQMAAAASQEFWPVRELLTATVLEAALRSLYGEPFVPGLKGRGKADYIGSRMKRFQDDYLGRVWKEVRLAVVEAHRRVRHRNAHPDWMVTSGGRWSEVELDQAYSDVHLLERFYGAFVLALADIHDLEPDQVLHGP